MSQRLVVLLLTLTAALSACTQKPSADEPTPVSIIGHNYTNEGIHEFFVNGGWGGGLGIGEGGGGIVCCVVLPPKWTPDLKATVKWWRSDCGPEGPRGPRCPVPPDFETSSKPLEWHDMRLKKEVSIEPYEKPGALLVVFLPDDVVKIYVESAAVTSPQHPLKLGRARPLDNPDWKAPE